MNATRWKLLASCLIALVGLALLHQLKDLQLADIWATMGRFPGRILALGLGLAMLQTAAQAARLWILLPRTGGLGLVRVLEVVSFGQFVNMFLPGRMGDGLKTVAFTRQDGNKSGALSMAQAAGGVLLADKLMEVLTLLVLVAGFLLLRPEWVSELHAPVLTPRVGGWIACGVLAFGLLGYGLWRRYRGVLRRHVGQLLESSRGILHPGRFSRAFAAGAVMWAAEGCVIVLLSRALGFDLDFIRAVGVLIVLNVGIAIPLSFANVGPYEASIAFGLSHCGLPWSESLAIAATHHLLQVAAVGLWCGFFFCRSWLARGDFRVRHEDKTRAIAYYDALAGDYNRSVERGVLKGLRARERESLLRMADFRSLSQREPTAWMADVGCGGGFYALAAKATGLNVCAVDISPGMVAHLQGQVDDAHVADIEALAHDGRRFDVVVCSGVLDFVLNPGRSFANLAELVVPGGRLVVLVPRRSLGGLYFRFEKWLIRVRINLYTRAWFEKEAEHAGFSIAAYEHPLPHNMSLLFLRHVHSVPEH